MWKFMIITLILIFSTIHLAKANDCSSVEIYETADEFRTSIELPSSDELDVSRINLTYLVNKDVWLTSIVAKGAAGSTIAATIKVFTNLPEPNKFVSQDSITMVFNQVEPKYIIDQLDEHKLLTDKNYRLAQNSYNCMVERVDELAENQQNYLGIIGALESFLSNSHPNHGEIAVISIFNNDSNPMRSGLEIVVAKIKKVEADQYRKWGINVDLEDFSEDQTHEVVSAMIDD